LIRQSIFSALRYDHCFSEVRVFKHEPVLRLFVAVVKGLKIRFGLVAKVMPADALNRAFQCRQAHQACRWMVDLVMRALYHKLGFIEPRI
jgi:hypothetical protein